MRAAAIGVFYTTFSRTRGRRAAVGEYLQLHH
jgi:hypothetical protein